MPNNFVLRALIGFAAFALLPVGAAELCEESDDDVCLLQSHVNTARSRKPSSITDPLVAPGQPTTPNEVLAISTSTKQRLSEEDPCTCLNWLDVYRKDGMHCGDGFEFGPMAREAKKKGGASKHARFNSSGQFRMICREHYMMRNDKMCTQTRMSEYVNQWCYTSSKCKTLGGGHTINKDVSIKTCTMWKDVLMLMMPPIFLIDTSKTLDYDLGVTMKMSYPAMKNRWEDVKAVFLNLDDAMDLISNDTLDKMKVAKDTGLPLLFDARESKKGETLAPWTMETEGDFVVARNESIWLLRFKNDPNAKAGERYKDICLRNCGPTKKSPWLVIIPTIAFVMVVLCAGRFCITDGQPSK